MLGIKSILKVALVVTAAVFANSAANAATFNVTSTIGELGVTGSLSIDLDANQTGLNLGEYRFDVVVTNNDDAFYSSSNLLGFYLKSTPSSTHVSDTSQFNHSNNTLLQPFATVYDFCFEGDSNGNCLGGNSGFSLGEGDSDAFKLVVSASSLPIFTSVGMRWQAVDGPNVNDGSAKGECVPGTFGCGPPVNIVPLPAGLPLLLSAFGIGAFVSRKGRKKA